MALWLVRTDKDGFYEQLYLDEGRVYLCWPGLRHDLGKLSDRDELKAIARELESGSGERAIGQWVGNAWAFATKIKPGDWVVVPSRRKSAVHIAEVASPYRFDEGADDPLYHFHEVRWIEQDIPRSNFDPDLQCTFAARRTVSRFSRKDAEQRVRHMAANGWKHSAANIPLTTAATEDNEADDTSTAIDLAQLARDQIASLIITRFKGHGMERLVEAILQAQGYTTHHSPVGPDKGIDFLAAPGALGFGEPRICVQVKSTDGPIDLPTLNQLVGSMENVRAKQGLLVSWGGFKSSVDRERAAQFFRVRLWDQNDLIEQLLAHYDKLDDDIRAELPLKRIWIVATQGDEN